MLAWKAAQMPHSHYLGTRILFSFWFTAPYEWWEASRTQLWESNLYYPSELVNTEESTRYALQDISLQLQAIPFCSLEWLVIINAFL